MAATVTLPLSSRPKASDSTTLDLGFACKVVTALTLLALAVHGYHPYAEDGGLYMAEVKRQLDPSLYPHGTEFVAGHLRFSLFGSLTVGLVHWSRMTLGTILLLLHVASFWTTLLAAWLLTARCHAARVARVGAVMLLATWITLPIAGTSLMLMDPYVTARSISTPCVLLALACVLDLLLPPAGGLARRRGVFALFSAALLLAAVMHPLMAAYGFGCVLVLVCILSSLGQVQIWGTAGLGMTALGVAAAIQAMAPPESAAYAHAAMTRSYWFPGSWHWYEQFGLIAPMILLAVVGFGRRREGDAARVALARMAVVCGGVAIVIAGMFARQGLATHAVARLQPLRIFQIVYVVMILFVGATLAERLLRRRVLRWVTTFGLLAMVMLFAERQTFPSSSHLELPWRAPHNQWKQAFVWISENTPKDALFALDAHYITSPGEDAQSFRAIAERSMLPDYSKDGGEASITPGLTSAWTAGVTAQMRLSDESDAQRIATLRPMGVMWVVLRRSSPTAFECDYANERVKVCRLPDTSDMEQH
ncbi:MAG: hypothetical protein J0G35_15045 [Acidobacteriales bacterium]|nr:hypothetical protein [Terriglobales bacterium]